MQAAESAYSPPNQTSFAHHPQPTPVAYPAPPGHRQNGDGAVGATTHAQQSAMIASIFRAVLFLMRGESLPYQPPIQPVHAAQCMLILRQEPPHTDPCHGKRVIVVANQVAKRLILRPNGHIATI